MPLFFQMPKNFPTMQLWRLFSLTILFSSLLFYIRIFIAAILEGQGRGNYLEKHFVPHNLIVKEFVSLPSVFTKAQFVLFCLFTRHNCILTLVAFFFSMNLLQNHADLPWQNFAKRRFKASSLDTLQFSYKNLNNVVLYYLLTREITSEGGVVSFCNTKRV